MSEEMMSMALLIFGIATLIGNKVGGFLGDKVGISKSLTGSMLVHVIALVLISLFADQLMLQSHCFLYGL